MLTNYSALYIPIFLLILYNIFIYGMKQFKNIKINQKNEKFMVRRR
jgi:hypothetical protein